MPVFLWQAVDVIGVGGGRRLGEKGVLDREAARGELSDRLPLAFDEFDECKPSAAGAREGVDVVDAFEQRRPVEAGCPPGAFGGDFIERCRRRFLWLIRLVRRDCLRPRDDLFAPGAVRSEDTVKTDERMTGRRNERAEG
jgi:hypothetical protein